MVDPGSGYVEGIFEINEVLILSGAQIRDTPTFLEEREEILRKYGIIERKRNK